MPESFAWIMLLPQIGHNHDLVAIVHSWMVVGLLIVLAAIAGGQIKKATAQLSNEELVPADKLTLRNVFEIYVEFILNMMSGLLGSEARRHFWLVGTIFIYVFVSNMLGVLPGFLPPTENINTNAAIALVVFVVYNAVGIKAQGIVNYFKHLMGPVLMLAPLMVLIETIGHLVRPVTLSIRLFGNINGDHIVLGIFSQLIPNLAGWPLALGIPIVFLVLGMLVAFIQAFVFSLLSTIYIATASAGHDDHGHGDHGHGDDHHHH
ncbi:MAG: F0F1 ATP synthase subunit A [Myxococcota bacterium]